MLKVIKKNQLTLLVFVLMLVTAGYLNYNSNQNITTSTEIASLGDATLVSSNAIVENETTCNNTISNETENTVTTNGELVENTAENSSDENINKNDNKSVTTNVEAEADNSDYYSISRLDRDKMYSQMLESYQKILDSNTTSNKQKETAQKEIVKVNNIKNSIMISENLIKTKGFEDCIVYSNEKSVDVVIKKDKLKKEETAQIQSVVAREMNVKISQIHIMTK